MNFWWDQGDNPRPFGSESVKLDGFFVSGKADVGERGDNGEVREVSGLVWQPDKNTQDWLQRVRDVFKRRLNRSVRVPTELVLYGNRIYSDPGRDKTRLYLDGDLFLDVALPGGARYPSGDGRRGGDLRLPFTLRD